MLAQSVPMIHSTVLQFRLYSTRLLRRKETIEPLTSLTQNSTSKKIAQLPSSYSEVPPVALPSGQLHVPETTGQLVPQHQASSNSESDRERDWLDKAKELRSKEELSKSDFISWAAYCASKCSSLSQACHHCSPSDVYENTHSLAMIGHSMKVIKSAVEHINPSQIPVIAVDQPLYALAKQIQWTLGEMYSEDQYVIMLGGLHIEMASFKMLGKWLNYSGWAEALCNAGVATQGVADSFLAASHLTRTRRAHQVTAAGLYVLMSKGYEEYPAKVDGSEQPKSFQEWKEEMQRKCPQFLYWAGVLDLQLSCLQLVRASREANFSMYVKAVNQILPWFFALDHPNYARWLSVHYRDMCM